MHTSYLETCNINLYQMSVCKVRRVITHIKYFPASILLKLNDVVAGCIVLKTGSL